MNKKHLSAGPGLAASRGHAWRAFAGLLLALTLGIAGCKDQNAPAAQKSSVPVAVGVAEVEKRPITPATSFVGRIEAVRSVDLIARVNGYVRKQAYTDGEEVKPGTLLFVLEKDPYQAAVNAARANLAEARANAANAKVQAARARALARNRNIPLSTLDERESAEKQAMADIQQAEAQLEQAEINLGYTEIRAPFSGRVGRAHFKLGAFVGPETGPLATIVSQDPVYVTFPVADRLLLDFRAQAETGADLGEAVTVRLTLSNGDEYPYLGKIDFTGVQVDRSTDTLLVRAVVPNPDRLLIDGQYVRVSAEQRQREMALLIPQRALMVDQAGASVFVVGPDKKVAQRTIKTGPSIGTKMVVEQGLQPGELVVVDGLQQLRPGAVVEPKPVADVNGSLPGAKAELVPRERGHAHASKSAPAASPRSARGG